jgi:hypothetical protein
MLLLALGRAKLFQAASQTCEGVERGRRQGQPKGQGRWRWLRAKGGSNGWQLQGHNPTSLQQQQALAQQPGQRDSERLRGNTKQRVLGAERTVIRPTYNRQARLCHCEGVGEWKRSLGWPGGKKPHDGKRQRQRQRRGSERRRGH